MIERRDRGAVPAVAGTPFVPSDGCVVTMSVSAARLEDRLLAAAAEGLEANFARWLRFIGAEHGEWIELQALKIPTRYGKKNRFAHVDSVAAALPPLRQGDSF